MSKYRVYEIAKDYNTTSKVIIDILARNGILAKNHMTSIDDDAKVVIERTFARKTGPIEGQQDKQPQKLSVTTPPAVQPSATTDARTPQQRPVNAHNSSSEQAGMRPHHQQMQHRPNVDNQMQRQSPEQQQQGGYDRRPPVQQQQQQGGYDRRPPVQQQQQQGGYDRRPPMQQQQQQGGYDRRPPVQQQQQQGGYDRRPPVQQQQQQGGYDRRPPVQQQQQQGGYDRRPPVQQQQQQGGYDRRPPMQQQGSYDRRPPMQQQSANRPPFANQGNRPGDQTMNRSQNFNGPRPGGAQARPQPGNNNRFDNQPKPAPATSQPMPTRRKPEASGQQMQKEKQQHQREQIFSKKHEQRRGPSSRNHGRSQAVVAVKQEPVRPKLIKLGDSITVKDLAAKLGRQVSDVIKKLMMLGTMATINQELDFETATLIAGEFGSQVEQLPPEESAYEIAEVEDDPDTLMPRPPVVTIMGHVDHGKTSLLDAIRQTHVTSQEAGGITQHIGAYQVNYQGKKIVFLDTPGHEAFTAMRARGAQVTDIAILVVAADDGVMPQTIEALNHAKSAKVPIIVAVNKMDKADANPDRVKQQLSDHGLIPEDWGGETIFVPVSAYKKSGIPDLLEMILLVAEIQDLKANPNRDAVGTIVEAQLDKGRGPVATVLIQKGTLHVGDTIIAGTAFGKVRAMINDRGDKVKKAEPSMPVEVLGLSDVPQAGDVLVVADEKVVRAVADKRVAKKRTDEMQHTSKVSLDDLFKQIQDGQIKDLNIVVKADVQGSIEALRQALQNLKNKEVRVNIVHSGVGAINESDVMLASASNALIIGFNVRPDNNARKASENEKIDIRTYRVIYEALNDVEAAMSGMLAPEYKEVIQGRAEVRQLISVPKTVVAGSYVLEGKITNASQVRLIRSGIVVYEGKVDALRRFKDDVKEVATGYECGISLEKFRDIREGDIIEAFTMELVK